MTSQVENRPPENLEEWRKATVAWMAQATQQNLIAWATSWQDQFPNERAEFYIWLVIHEYPISRFTEKKAAQQWCRWFNRETEKHAADGREDMYSDMAYPIIQPVCLVERSPNSTPEIWDGWHRIASNIVYQREHLPAIVGIKRRE
jgi:hypothetical protein